MTFALTYATGTISVANGSTAVTGSGVTWTAIREGDSLIDPATGARGIIASIEDTSGALTLLDPWPGTSLTDDPYRIVYDSPARRSGVVVSAAIEELVANQTILLARRADYLVQDALLDTPPGSPTAGDVYLVGTSPSGAWSGKAGYLATWTDAAAWAFTAPETGMRAVDVSVDPPAFYFRGASAWSIEAAAGGMAKSVYDPNDDGVVDYITNALAQAGSGAEGGQINLEKASTSTIAGNVALDINGDRVRIFEQGGTARGVYVDLTECGTNASSKLFHQDNVTAAGRALLEAADVAAQRTALGVTMIKTGTVNAGASSGTVNFAAAFPTACLTVHLQVIGSSGSTTSYAAHLDGAPSAAAFSWYLRQTVAAGTTGASTAVGFRWTAFGN